MNPMRWLSCRLRWAMHDENRELRADREQITGSRDHWRALAEERQAAIDEALSWMRGSEYVGGPSERDAWQAALRVLGPLETQHIGVESKGIQEGSNDG